MEAGAREIGANNDGPFVEKYHGFKADHAWCAAFVSWCFEEASRRSGIPMPFKRSGSAKALFRNVAKAGIRSDFPKVGAVVAWNRGDASSWTGHIGLVCSVEQNGTFHAIEGNVGSFRRTAGRVREIEHRVDDQQLLGFATLEER